MASRDDVKRQIRPHGCDPRDWTRALLEDRVRARTFEAVVSVAVARLLAEATLDGAVHPNPDGWEHWQGARDAAVAREIGLPKRTLTNLRLGYHRSQSAQVDLILTSPAHGMRLVALVIDGLTRLADPLSRPKSRGQRDVNEVYLVHDPRMATDSTRTTHLTLEQRQRLELIVLHGVATLTTGRPAEALPKTGGWQHPENIRWDSIGMQISGVPVKAHHAYRDMVRAVVPDTGDPISNTDIQRLIKERYGVGSPDARTINLAIDGLRRMGELDSVGYGKQQATHLFRGPKRSTNPHGFGRLLRQLALPSLVPNRQYW